MDHQGPFNVLFLCTGNSARSIMAEAILNGLGRGKFKAFSAGSRPVGRVNPLALELLEKNRLPIQSLRSKDWTEFSQPEAPFMHFVFTVCDQAAAEMCPGLARTADDRALGRSRSGSDRGKRGTQKKSVSKGIHRPL
jgi:protein-tyrosine-phosphatase